MTYQEVTEWLFAQLPMYQRVGQSAYKADLKNTLDLMELLKHPENKFKSVHVAGTNGKGSTSHMLAAIFQKAGYKTGLYTSPHLKDFRERIRINGQMIPKQAVISFVEDYKEAFKKMQLSFFEMTVGMAFNYFAKEEVDIAIIEVGMGGRLDSTNVITPELSIITNISLDHTQFLGNSISQIAREKGGIIKPEVPVLIGERQQETELVFKEIAHEKSSPFYYSADILPAGWMTYKSDLTGSYQEKNIKTVLAACNLLQKNGFNLKNHIQVALKEVTTLTGLQGRWQQIGHNPTIITDTGHNVAGVIEILDQLKKMSYRQLHMVWGMVGDKDISGVLRLLPKSAFYYFCKPEIPRGKNAEELKREAVKFGLSGKSYTSVSEALKEARMHTLADDLIFVGGSTFVVAEVL